MPIASKPFKVETGVKMPPAKRKKSSRYPWDTIKPGQSFFIPGKAPKGLYTAAKSHGIRIAIRAWKQGSTVGIRVWRLAGSYAAKKGKGK